MTPAAGRAAAASRRVWVFSELYYPEETSTGYFLTGIAEGLAPYFEVHAVCSQPTYSQRGVVAPREEVRRGVAITRCPSSRLNKDALLPRLVNAVTITLAMFLTALRRLRRSDGVLVVTNPPFLPFAIVLAARLRGAHPVLLIHDVYPEVLVATGMASPQSAVVRLLAALTRRLYRAADRIVVLGRDMEVVVRRKLGPAATPVARIPNWGDVTTIAPADHSANPVLARLGIRGKFVVQFMGNMGRTHGVEALVAAATRLRDDPAIHFLFIGWGSRRAWLEREVATLGLGNVTVLPPCARKELGDHLGACDVACIPLLPGMTGVSVPSRLYNVLAAGRPVVAVAEDASELASVVREERVGWVVPPDDIEALVDTLREAASQPACLAEMAVRARRAAEARYAEDVVVREYRSLFEQLLAGR